MTGLALLVYTVMVIAVTAALAVLVGDAVAEFRSLQAERLQRARVPARRRDPLGGARTRHPA